MGWVGDHGGITTVRGAAAGGQVPDGRRGSDAHAGVEDDRLPAGALRRTHRGAGRPIVPGAGTRGTRLPTWRVPRVGLVAAAAAGPAGPRWPRSSAQATLDRDRDPIPGTSHVPPVGPVHCSARCRRRNSAASGPTRAFVERAVVWAPWSRSAASAWPRRSTASCCARPACSVAVSASDRVPGDRPGTGHPAAVDPRRLGMVRSWWPGPGLRPPASGPR